MELETFLQRGGGRWRTHDSSNAVDLNLYADVKFEAIEIVRNELVVQLSLRAPKGAGSAREITKKLGRGGLVGLLLRQVDARGVEELKVFLGELSDDVVWFTRGAHKPSIVKVAFHDPAVFASATQHLGRRRNRNDTRETTMTFFEVPGFILGTLLPFLRRLQSVEPSSIPFHKYIAASTDATVPLAAMEPPRFARNPSFSYKLSGLLRPDASDGDLSMNANDPEDVMRAREVLKAHSGLDLSQADAMVDCFTREVAMIEG
jgi:hypothetical protein